MIYKHTRLDRVIGHYRLYYKFSDTMMNSIDYAGDVYVDDKDLYSNGDYIIDGYAYIVADGTIE